MSLKRQRGSNFSNAEESQLARSWLNVSQDATTGVGQKSSTFWERVEAHFQQQMGEGSVPRSVRSLASKWSTVQHDVSKFVGSYAAIKDLNPSGAGEEDMIKKALGLYKSTNSDQKSSEFAFLHVWNILKDFPKWQDLRSKQDLPSNQARRLKLDENDEIVEWMDDPALGKQQGCKAGKEQKKAAIQNSRAAVSLADAQQTKAKAMLLQARMALFSADIESMDEDAKHFFKLARAEVLDSMKKQTGGDE